MHAYHDGAPMRIDQCIVLFHNCNYYGDARAARRMARQFSFRGMSAESSATRAKDAAVHIRSRWSALLGLTRATYQFQTEVLMNGFRERMIFRAGPAAQAADKMTILQVDLFHKCVDELCSDFYLACLELYAVIDQVTHQFQLVGTFGFAPIPDAPASPLPLPSTPVAAAAASSTSPSAPAAPMKPAEAPAKPRFNWIRRMFRSDDTPMIDAATISSDSKQSGGKVKRASKRKASEQESTQQDKRARQDGVFNFESACEEVKTELFQLQGDLTPARVMVEKIPTTLDHASSMFFIATGYAYVSINALFERFDKRKLASSIAPIVNPTGGATMDVRVAVPLY